MTRRLTRRHLLLRGGERGVGDGEFSLERRVTLGGGDGVGVAFGAFSRRVFDRRASLAVRLILRRAPSRRLRLGDAFRLLGVGERGGELRGLFSRLGERDAAALELEDEIGTDEVDALVAVGEISARVGGARADAAVDHGYGDGGVVVVEVGGEHARGGCLIEHARGGRLVEWRGGGLGVRLVRGVVVVLGRGGEGTFGDRRGVVRGGVAAGTAGRATRGGGRHAAGRW